MKHIFTALVLLVSVTFAEVLNEYPSQQLLEKKIPVVDIRTPAEWKETGVFKGAIPIMFFNEQGAYDLNGFLKELQSKVDTSKPFALVCRTGSRTKIVAHYLAKELGYTVIDLQGGMTAVQALKLPIEPYKK